MLSMVAGCAVNPVTGKQELNLVSRSQEIAIGQEQYLPSQQMQGGAFRTDPALTPYVSRVGQRIAGVTGIDLPYEFVVLNNSVPNAWALPGGKIAVNRGLLTELDSEAELAAVLGHEVAHATIGHGARQIERGLVMQGVMMAAVLGARNSDYAGAVVGAGQLGAALITSKFSRDAEREADYYGTGYMKAAGYNPLAAVTLQEKFVRLARAQRQDWLSGLFSSHPPSMERVKNNQIRARELGEQGEIGDVAYQQATAFLKKNRDAYAAYDRARKALGDKNETLALKEVDQALQQLPIEAAFHGLRGDIRYGQERFPEAVTNYERALKLDDGYFAYYLGRGMAESRMNNLDAARFDLEKSLTLLPTAVAYNQLGRIAESTGDIQRALAYYKQASESGSSAGRAAAARYQALDVQRNPGNYITAIVSSNNGLLLLQVRNRTSHPLRNVVVRVVMQWADGARRDLTPKLGRLDAGAQKFLELPQHAADLTFAEAYVVSAEL